MCAFIYTSPSVSTSIPLSVFPGSLVLQVGFEGGIDGIFVCVDIKEKVGRETGVNSRWQSED